MYDFVTLVYPAADPSRAVDATFERVLSQNTGDVEPAVLFGYCRDAVLERRRPRWRRSNARLVREQMRQQGALMSDWHAWNDLGLLLEAFAALTLDEQELLTIDTVVDGLRPPDLAVILRRPVAETAAVLENARRQLRLRFGANPATEEVEP